MATLADKIESERKQDLAWRLHLAGATVQEIAATKDPDRADNLFQDARGAAQALAAVRRRMASNEEESEESDDKIRSKIRSDIAALRRLKRALWPAATAGDVAAAREIRQLTMAAAQLAGYVKGAPEEKKVEASDTVDDLARKRDARRAAGG